MFDRSTVEVEKVPLQELGDILAHYMRHAAFKWFEEAHIHTMSRCKQCTNNVAMAMFSSVIGVCLLPSSILDLESIHFLVCVSLDSWSLAATTPDTRHNAERPEYGDQQPDPIISLRARAG